MKREDFDFLADLLKRGSGLSLHPDKDPQTGTRLKRIAERHGFSTVMALVRELECGNMPLARVVTEAMTIQDTAFFRDREVFDGFHDTVLPKLLRARASRRRLSIWSAACATGEEPYSLAMMFDLSPQCSGWEIEILASDVSAEAVARASEGFYTDAEVQRGLPLPMLSKHFRRQSNGWRIARAIRSRVEFRVFNLLDSFAGLGSFDAVFCRNVLIYFDDKAKQKAVSLLYDSLRPGGFLLIGSSESLHSVTRAFKPVIFNKVVAYQRV
jgi:chemotaxis protein methyltransferase CheR